MCYLKRLYICKVKYIAVFCVGMGAISPSSASAGIDELWGKTAVCSIASGNAFNRKEKYYFGKSKKRIFSPASPDSYGSNKGAVYTLGKETCQDYKFSYKDRGKTIYGNGRECGSFKVQGNTVFLTNNDSSDNGFGIILTGIQKINLKYTGPNKLDVSGSWSATNDAGTARAGTVSGRYNGSCTLVENCDVKKKAHTKYEQIECCIEYTSKMCNGGVISLPSNECTKGFIRRQCKTLVGDGGIYCND